MKVSGWKTITGAILVSIGTLMTTLPPFFEAQAEIGQILIGIGASLGAVGLGHKIEKAVPK